MIMVLWGKEEQSAVASVIHVTYKSREARTVATLQKHARSAIARATSGWPASNISWPARLARAFALRAEVCRFAPLALFSFLASRYLNLDVNTSPMEKICFSLNLQSSPGFGKRVTQVGITSKRKRARERTNVKLQHNIAAFHAPTLAQPNFIAF